MNKNSKIDNPSYNTHDRSEAIEVAKELLAKVKQNKKKLHAYRVDPDTIVQIGQGKNAAKIIDKLKNRQSAVTVEQQVQYT